MAVHPGQLNTSTYARTRAEWVTADFITLQTALNWLVDNYSGLADCLSSVNRVASLLLALDPLAHDSQVRTQDFSWRFEPTGD
jgi:ABC-type uncharacterized transport system fused permease/ATPase subunit